VGREVVKDRCQGNPGGLLERIAINPRADGREGQAFQPVCGSQFQAFPVRAGQDVRFTVGAAPINWTDGVNNVPGLEIAARGYDRLAGGATPDFAALSHNGRSAGPVNGAVDPAPASQAAVGGIDQGIRFIQGDVALNQDDTSVSDSMFHIPIFLSRMLSRQGLTVLL